jgi:hypothetical protein
VLLVRVMHDGRRLRHTGFDVRVSESSQAVHHVSQRAAGTVLHAECLPPSQVERSVDLHNVRMCGFSQHLVLMGDAGLCILWLIH